MRNTIQMNSTKKKRLKTKGWKIGNTKEFLRTKPHLDFYLANVISGRLPDYGGLCGQSDKFPGGTLSYELLRLFAPTEYEANNSSIRFWFDINGAEFNHLRQTVVLLMAAMNGEL